MSDNLHDQSHSEHHQHAHSLEHQHGHHHAHGHAHQVHGHEHGHAHGGGKDHKNDGMTGDKYWRWPGLRETALKTSQTTIWALQQMGASEAEISKMDLLEVGCGGGAVTRLFSPSFGSIHAIDVVPSMLSSLSQHVPSNLLLNPPTSDPSSRSSKANVFYSVHTLSPSSPEQFSAAAPQPSPTPSEPSRALAPPRVEFDVAVTINVLHHVSDVEGFMSGLKGLLGQGGKVVFIEPHGLVKPTGDHVAIEEQEEGVEPFSEEELQRISKHGHDHSHFFSPDGVVDLLNKHGFKDVQHEMHGTMPAFGVGRDELGCAVIWGRL